MLVIRLFRVGKKNQPSFKIVVTDKKKPPRAGRFIEEVGFYNPLKKEKVLKLERIKYWISVGAKPSDTIHNLLISEKIIEGKKKPIHMKKVKEEAKTTAEVKTEKELSKEKESLSSDSLPSEETSKDVSGNILEEASEKISEETSEKILEETSKDVSEKVLEDISEKTLEEVSEKISEVEEKLKEN